jgi:hypothetical protein
VFITNACLFGKDFLRFDDKIEKLDSGAIEYKIDSYDNDILNTEMIRYIEKKFNYNIHPNDLETLNAQIILRGKNEKYGVIKFRLPNSSLHDPSFLLFFSQSKLWIRSKLNKQYSKLILKDAGKFISKNISEFTPENIALFFKELGKMVKEESLYWNSNEQHPR